MQLWEQFPAALLPAARNAAQPHPLHAAPWRDGRPPGETPRGNSTPRSPAPAGSAIRLCASATYSLSYVIASARPMVCAAAARSASAAAARSANEIWQRCGQAGVLVKIRRRGKLWRIPVTEARLPTMNHSMNRLGDPSAQGEC